MSTARASVERPEPTTLRFTFFNRKNDAEPKLRELTWEEVIARFSRPAVRRQKDGELFSPATFDGRRAKGNVTEVSALVLDYDHQADFGRDLKVWREIGCALLAYTSHSHLRRTERNPEAEQRFRVIVPLKDPIPAEQFTLLWQWALEMSGGKIDKAASDASRMYYTPAIMSKDAPFQFVEEKGAFLDWRTLNLQDTSRAPERAPSTKRDCVVALDANAEPPFSKFEMLAETEQRFRQTWERRRKDLKDQSPSSYDMALANYAAQAGWSDQDITSLLIAFRRKHGHDLKLRPDYYAQTINKARDSISTCARLEDASWDDEDSEDGFGDEGGLGDEEVSADPVQSLRRALTGTKKGKKQGLPIKHIIKRGVLRSDYDIELVDGTLITLGSASHVLTPSKVQAAIADGYGLVIRAFTKAKWRPIAQLICDAAIVVETSSEESETHGWLAEFVRTRFFNVPVDLDDPDQKREAINGLRDFGGEHLSGFRDRHGRVYIRLNHFVRFVTLEYGARTTERDASNRLSRLGFEGEQLSARVGRSVDKVRVWKSPLGFVSNTADEDDLSNSPRGVPRVPYIQ